MKMINKIPYVPVFVNGEGPFQFLFDTGCWSPRLSIDVSNQLSLKLTDRGWTCLDSLQVSHVELRNYDIGVDDMSLMSKRGRAQVDGITGFGLFQESILIFDYRTELFDMWRSDQFMDRDLLEGKPIPLEICNRYPCTQVMINNCGPYRFLIDTGSMGSNISIEVSQQLNLEIGKEVTIRGGRPNDAQRVHESRVSVMAVGDAEAFDVKVLVKSCEPNSAHTGVKIDGVLGYEFLKAFRVAMDYPQGVLRLSQ